jgi:hypothetical protein
VEIFRFDRGEKIIRNFGSKRLLATRIAAGNGRIHLTCLTVEPGSVIGTHPATEAQLFLVIAGAGWTAGPDGEQAPITTGWALNGSPERSTPAGRKPVSPRSLSKASLSTCSSQKCPIADNPRSPPGNTTVRVVVVTAAVT